MLRRGLPQRRRRATDDAALVELGGHHVVVVEGDPLAFKVTTRDDLEHAERVLAQRAAAARRPAARLTP